MSAGTWQGGLLAWAPYLLGTTLAMAAALVWGRGRRTGMEDEMDVEIARYPMRCHRCGRTEQVRVVVEAMHDEDVYRSIGILPTQRYAPDGWKWERDEDGQPLWVCPECSGGGAE